MGARRGRLRCRRAGRAHRGARAQVPRLLPLPGAGRARHRAVGPARQARGQAGRGAARRHAAAAARLRLVDEARHHARAGGRAPRAPARRARASTPSSCASAPSAAATSTSGRAAPRRSCRTVRARWATACAKLVDANSGFSPPRAIEVGRLLEAEGIEPLRGALPLLGARADQGGDRRARRSTSPAASRTATSRPGSA